MEVQRRRVAPMVLLWVAALAATTHTDEDWKTWLERRASAFSGSVLIGEGDAIQFTGAYGLADRDAGRPNTAETRFNLGSINKTFTAIAIAQLIQRGRLTLEDTLAKHIPDYPNREAATQITIQQLLSHRSGIGPFMRGDFGGATTVAEMVKVVAAEPLAFAPGAQQQYSNGGYVLLGRIVELLSGETYTGYISDHIYKRAEMISTGFAKAGDRDQRLAMGYSPTALGQPVREPRPGNPAGGGYSTVTDLFRFSRALRGGRLLDERMTDFVLTGTFSGASGPRFGFALREQAAGTRRFVGNGGGAPGVNAEFRFEPAGEFTVVVLANSSPPAATRLLNEILERLASQQPTIPDPK
jgi:D-alanyl-D-alanine carboxypeptidase